MGAQWSFATLRYYPTAAIDALCAGVWQRRRELKAQEVCNIVWALARLGHHPGRMLAALDPSITARMPDMTRQGVANVLWALAVLQASRVLLHILSITWPGPAHSRKHTEHGVPRSSSPKPQCQTPPLLSALAVLQVRRFWLCSCRHSRGSA